jgi:thiamine pyrophosphokinase
LGKALNHFTTTFKPHHLKANDNENDNEPLQNIIILGGLSGRLDHTIHTLSTMLKMSKDEPNIRLWVFGQDSMAVVLPPVRPIVSPLFSLCCRRSMLLSLDGMRRKKLDF